MSGIVLAIETALNLCSVALARDGEIVFVREHGKTRAHAEQLVPMIKSALDAVTLTAKDIDAVAVSCGPGSYTGLRIGVSTAKGICLPTGAALVPVPTLLAIARRTANTEAVSIRAEPTIVAVAMRARAKELYWALYRADYGADYGAAHGTEHQIDGVRVEPIARAVAIKEDDAVSGLLEAMEDGRRVLLCGTAADQVRALVEAKDHTADVRGRIALAGSPMEPLATTVAQIGTELLADGVTADLRTYEPAYLKEFVAGRPKLSIFDQLRF